MVSVEEFAISTANDVAAAAPAFTAAAPSVAVLAAVPFPAWPAAAASWVAAEAGLVFQ